MTITTNVLIAGIGGASLGTEIFKCLIHANRRNLNRQYNIFGCDISKYAYGIYDTNFKETYIVDKNHYISNIIDICKQSNINYVLPGGDSQTLLLSKNKKLFDDENITLVINSPEIIEQFTDKSNTFKILSYHGFKVPFTLKVKKFSLDYFKNVKYPCIIKPSKDSGGSNGVFLIENQTESAHILNKMLKNNIIPIIQEYIPETDGEFTVGVLSLKNKNIISSIALKRMFDSKLSVKMKSFNNNMLISSGYTQGLIDNFQDIRLTCEDIAIHINSEGPINIQGRVKDDEFIPFEINPRFSGSVYLRALAGVNEVDLFLQYLITGEVKKPDLKKVKYGYYLRSFTENYIPKENIANLNMEKL